MSKFAEMIETMRTAEYREKRQFLQYLVQMSEKAKHSFTQEDKIALLDYAYQEADAMLTAIPAAANYK